ncbi:hypothetical protein KI688_012297 [Linnemannia hyalina]|uniref:HCP-like protein n=1 Tax=Linnemannia hyalina TaxID=64524 RepID=A0A9P7XX46_9FUNG|nr:hypothetical protein KI688_012297 [Linnemannia hyalina]
MAENDETPQAQFKYRNNVRPSANKASPQDFCHEMGGLEQGSTQAAKKRNTITALNLETLYEERRGVPQDYAKVLLQYTKASRKGSEDAYYAIAVFYDIGLGVGRNGWSAMEYY